MMDIKDLERLKLSIDVGDLGYYHGDPTVAFETVVNELFEIREALEGFDTEDLKDIGKAVIEHEEYRCKMDDLVQEVTGGECEDSFETSYNELVSAYKEHILDE